MLMGCSFQDLGDLSLFGGIRDETHEQNTEKGKNGRCQRLGVCLKGKILKEIMADSLGKEGHFLS